MLGKTTVFVPGYDHAGISTQSVVEKRLFKTAGKTRHDLGREKFIDTVLAWKNECVISPGLGILIFNVVVATRTESLSRCDAWAAVLIGSV